MFQNLNRLRLTGVDAVRPGLDRIILVLEKLGSPQSKKDYVIVAGTNGKGSVATSLASILEANGYRTGLFTSPHLVSVTERIKIGEEKISEQELESLLGEVFSICEKFQLKLSYFELLTVAAFLYFNSKSIDIGVLEVGMGGRWDATNVCDHIAGIITNVSFDHMEYLGNTLKKIALEKAGIIKKNSLIVTGCRGEALEVIEKKAKEQSAECFRIDEEFTYKKEEDLSFDYFGSGWNLNRLKTSLVGTYQVENAAISIAAAELLSRNTRYKINPEKVRETFAGIGLLGRMEYLREKPPLIMDGAHNTAAAKSLLESLEFYHPKTKFNFLLTMLENKEIGEFTEIVSRVSGKLIITELPGTKRSVGVEKIRSLVRGKWDSVEMIKDPAAAYQELLGYEDAACICGSFYLVGYLKEVIEHEETFDN